MTCMDYKIDMSTGSIYKRSLFCSYPSPPISCTEVGNWWWWWRLPCQSTQSIKTLDAMDSIVSTHLQLFARQSSKLLTDYKQLVFVQLVIDFRLSFSVRLWWGSVRSSVNRDLGFSNKLQGRNLVRDFCSPTSQNGCFEHTNSINQSIKLLV